MKKSLWLLLFFPSITFALSPDCPAGYWDLGERAAAIGLFCDEEQPSRANLLFCRRESLLQKGICTGRGQPVACLREEGDWICKEGGQHPFRAEIRLLTPKHLRYRFQSKFNGGELHGTLLENLPEPLLPLR